jgi:(p)ppGpp synthase/HD superfamily hydrolase
MFSGGADMIYTELTKRALTLCFAAHKDQVDKSGLPYVFHPFHLAEQMPDELTTVTALLHDVVEDTPYTLADLRDIGFPEPVLAALALLTHDDGAPYLAYVARIKENPIAKTVKLADLLHNSDLTRMDHVDEQALARVEKYRKAMELLNNP